MKFINEVNFYLLMDALRKDYEIFHPLKKGQQRFYHRYTSFREDLLLDEVRPCEPLKTFYTKAREIVASDFTSDIPGVSERPYCIVGVKACDLKGFKIQDFVFRNHDYPDPFYLNKRERNLIIAADCTCAIDTCFCLALGVKPYPEENFDLNLSSLGEDMTVEVGSAKGEAVIKLYSHLFDEAKEEAVTARNKQRDQVIKKVEQNIKQHDIPPQALYKGIVERNYQAAIWSDEAKTCVECGACNTICPTCHCFLLYDQAEDHQNVRLRVVDSCLHKSFATVAGGANPRPKLWMRLRNRFEKKFDFFPKIADFYACTGCGRCISACPAKIDIRKVLRRLVNNE